MLPEEIVKRPILLTEKATRLREKENKVVFEVARSANKIQIRDAVEKLFGVRVLAVNTSVVRGKKKRMGRQYGKLQNWKRAVVTLRPGDGIKFFEGQGG
jgi:large subunit ribosomal protein L23